MIPTLYRGSVKDLLGPVRADRDSAVIFEYTDAYSVFDWGRMPDSLPRKGEALAILAADFFEKLERPETWRDFSRTPAALALRKGNRFGSSLNELGEELQTKGLRTHYLGLLPKLEPSGPVHPLGLREIQAPCQRLAVRQVSVVRPRQASVLGRAVYDYFPTRSAPAPRLVPLEVVFRFGCPPGSSLLERVSKDPGYLASLGFGEFELKTGVRWDFPVLELFTKLETSDRPLSLSEALAISGLSASQLQELLLRTAWVAAWVAAQCARHGLELADGKLEWGVDESGECVLVDAIGPDELRILKDGVQLSKEFLRAHYRKTPWYGELARAKEQAKAQGSSDWKRLVAEGPEPLSREFRELASQVYLSLCNQLTGRNWFPEAWSLHRVVEEIERETKNQE